MRVLIQRIRQGTVTSNGTEVGRVGTGLCLFLGISKDDTEAQADYLARKTVSLRIFEDETDKFNRSLLDIKGEVLIVSQFTLYGDCNKGRRPSFSRAAFSREAERLYDYFVRRVQELGPRVATGKFQAKMEVAIINEGPATFILDTDCKASES
ncbi:MAG: D-aminoacyl-tRNA deacylase [Candidatus Binatia bacterium]